MVGDVTGVVGDVKEATGFLFCCFIEVTMTLVTSVSDGLRD